MSEPTPPALFPNPFYLYPSDGLSSLNVQEKLIGAQNYRAWKRAIEIGLSTKRKLGFVKGTVVRLATDANLGELWDTCNNMVISWIMGSVSKSIARSIMFIGTATEIWQQLERRFSVSDGSRKYKLNKDTYEITQSGSSIGDYFTKMKCVWEGLDSLNTLPVIVRITLEIIAFLTALSKQKEEQRLFQFLNGLKDCYSHQRSQILMMNPLPNVESACSLIQQEESQRMLFGSSSNAEIIALYSIGNIKDKYRICGFKWNPPEKCREKVRYPLWHSKFKRRQSVCGIILPKILGCSGLDNKEGEGTGGTWVYLLEHKSESFEALKSFLKFVCTQFGKQVKIVRSDNALEFVKGQCGPYLTSQGIAHQTSCVDRPQQNGRVERKHRRYPSSQKGYKFYNLLTKSTFVSRDVVFHKDVFPFAADSINNFLTPLPATFPCQSKSTIDCDEFIFDTPYNNPPVPNTPSVPQTTNVPSRKSTRTKTLPPKLKDFVFHHTPRANQVSQTPLVSDFQDFVSSLLAQQDPLNFKQAIADPEWCGAMNDELRALENNADGTEDKKEAKLVVQGNRQKHGVDYKETFAPVAKMVTLRPLLAVVAVKGWFTCQMDVSNAFLHGDLFEEVYMRPPQGYAGQRRDVPAEKALDPSLVCKLKKSLYGLKQAPRQWFHKLSTALIEFGYTQSKTDYSLFVKKKDQSFTVVLVYVDNLLITGNDEAQICSIKSQLSFVFHMKDLGDLSYFLRLEVCKSSQGIFISQHKYTKELFKEWRVLNHKPYKLPMDPNLKLSADIGTPLPDPEVYRRSIGQLIYLTVTRPEICYTFQLLSDSPVSWKAKKHEEAEYRAMALTCCEVTWLVSLFKDPGITNLEPVDLHCDNQAALYIAANPVFHARTKHIEVDCHFVRDQLKSGTINPSYVNTKEQVADVFTKVITMEQHNKLLSKLGVVKPTNSQLEGECESTWTKVG
uniref:Cysteine-rich RLK (Receptor-like protein kinase) 8 n=1 Tax=Tanacetum cinerariifolium TaxID=118510 RepID=A0A6L2P0M3_TANCI|nr:cysteine-rich RLK (receptor-like protein kinase) 8 [Tanacetum cinerariifolium]